jgi:3-phosphoshikimate 1-carboxyvinyltransferase
MVEPLSSMDQMVVHPCAPLVGELVTPGDKSVSHRVAMLAGLADGVSRVHGFLGSADCLGTLKAMEALGASSALLPDGVLEIHGTRGKVLQPAGPLDVGNSGTSMRLLAGLLAGFDQAVTLTGDASLSKRPMGRIAEPLRAMGATIALTGERGTAPLTVRGGRLQAIDYVLPVASAQVKSAILLAGLFAEGTTSVTEPAPTRDHTERILAELGLSVEVDGAVIRIRGAGAAGLVLPAREWWVPGDISSAAFWLVAAATRPGAAVTMRNVGLNPRRTAVLDVLRRMGADLQVTPLAAAGRGEPVGDIAVRGGRLRGTVIEGDEIPNLIDELPILAVAGALAEGETVIRDAGELRVKESDRIAVMCANLRRMGVAVDEFDDGMRVAGPATVTAGEALDSEGDHRIAMSMAVLAQSSTAPVRIRQVACVETSYPGFRDHLKVLGGHVE